MLNGAPILRDASDRLDTTVVVTEVLFNGGTPMNTAGELVVDNTIAIPSVFHNGLGYTDVGALCCQLNGVIAGYTQGGLPVTASGRMATSSGATSDTYVAGIRIGADGRVAVV